MAWVYILRGSSGRHYIGSTDNLDRRIAEHHSFTTRRSSDLGATIELLAARELSSMAEARKLETALKRKKNPNLEGIAMQPDGRYGRAAQTAFGVGYGFESRPTQTRIWHGFTFYVAALADITLVPLIIWIAE